MRRLFIFLSILTAGLGFAASAQATSATLPSKAELENAVERIESFADYAKYYGAFSKSIVPNAPLTEENPHYQEYRYLNSLATKTYMLIDHYDEPDFTAKNAEAYAVALEAIDQAITSCRYTFGIVQKEKANQTESSQSPIQTESQNQNQAQSGTSTSAVTTPATSTSTASSTTTPAKASVSASASTSTGATVRVVVAKTDDTVIDAGTIAEETPETSENQGSTSTNDSDVSVIEIPNTGTSPVSVIFIVAFSLVAATAVTGVYFIRNRHTYGHARSAASSAYRKRH